MPKDWFADWFDSKYYHILYKNRNEREAEMFLEKLLTYLNPAKEAAILDLACGKGRHSVYLANQGYYVTGVDLSEKSIKAARKHESERLSFYTHDMRTGFRTNYYDYIFNLFTSFGYFDTEKDHLRTLENVTLGLKPGGHFLLDFFNAQKVIANLKARQQKTVDGICFKISRKVEAGYLVKRIKFEDKNRKYEFEERVRAFDKRTLNRLVKKAGLEPVTYWGDYGLNKFSPKNSDRLIMLCRKP